MAFTAATIGSGRAFSIGPVREQSVSFSTAAGDTSGVLSCANFITVESVEVSGGLVLSAAPVINNAVTPPTATLAFAASPTGGNFGLITIRGK